MFTSSTIRWIALLILLLSGAETLFCDVLAHRDAPQTTSASAQTSDEDCGCNDGCLCCCTHAMPAPAFMLVALDRLQLLPAETQPRPPDVPRLSIYHPPRA